MHMATVANLKDDYFKIDPECHLIGDMEPLNYYPGVQMWWRAIENIKRPLLTGTNVSLAHKLYRRAWKRRR